MSTPADIPFAGTATAPRVLTRSRAETPTASTRYASVEVTTRDAVMDLKDEWQRLEQISEGSAVFQSFDLCLPWLDAYVFGDAPLTKPMYWPSTTKPEPWSRWRPSPKRFLGWSIWPSGSATRWFSMATF